MILHDGPTRHEKSNVLVEPPRVLVGDGGDALSLHSFGVLMPYYRSSRP
jgi:hypothetical protein